MSHLFTWDKIVVDFKNNVSNDIGDLLFYGSQIIDVENGICYIQIDKLAYDILNDKNSPYYKTIKSLISNHYDVENVVFTTKQNIEKVNNNPMQINVANNYSNTKLKSTQTFDNYFYSYDNRKTIEACKIVIDEVTNDATELSFNPFFIYGASGIGKTHIANALGNEIFKLNNSKKILFKNATEFLNEYTNCFKGSLNNDSLDKFKEVYYNLDVLIIDDIQMLRTKNGSLNEFFSIFEKLRLNNKTIIITSDVNPKFLGFEDRLLTRLLSGLVNEMNFPDNDTKTQIFKAHASKNNLDIDEDAIQVFIESSPNVRELLGYINTINLEIITLGLQTSTYTKEQAIKTVKNVTGANINITKDDVIETVCSYFDVKPNEIKARSRKLIYVIPRNFCIYFLKENLDMTYVEISKEFNMRDHTNCVKIVNDFQNFKINHQEAYEYLAQKLNNM